MSYQFHTVSILVVEDNQPMLELTRSLLLTFGVGQVLIARNGNEGFKMFCEANPDIVIADWMMTPVDGISFTRMVRNDPDSPNSYAPVILMTGFSEKRRVTEARDSGVTEFLVKPFTARDLYRRISQVIERPRQFVKLDNFFGPDRRRTRSDNHQGPFRREEDRRNPKLAKLLLEQQKKIREKEIENKNAKEDAERKEEKNKARYHNPDDIDLV